MQGVTKIAVASVAMLLLGSSALLAQPYGYGRYGYGQNGYAPYGYGNAGPSNGPTPGYCGPMTSQITNWIIDPATGQAVTEAEYLRRYPWSNPASWSYSCNTGLWTDPGSPPSNYQAPSYYSQAPGYYRDGRGYRRESRNDRHDRNHEHG